MAHSVNKYYFWWQILIIALKCDKVCDWRKGGEANGKFNIFYISSGCFRFCGNKKVKEMKSERWDG